MSGAQPQPQPQPRASASGAARTQTDTASSPGAAQGSSPGKSAAQPQPQPQSQPQPQPAGQPHRPPQAYPAPSSGSADAGPDGPGGTEGAGFAAGGTDGAGVRKPRTGARTVPRTRKARLRVAKADPWSVMKVSFLLSIALGLCTIVAVAVLWMVMDAMGVFASIGGTVSEATSGGESGGFDLESFLSLPRVLLFTSVIAVIDVVLATALATLGAFIYNLSAGFVGGVELTLAEDE